MLQVQSIEPNPNNNIAKHRNENHFYQELALINLDTGKVELRVRFYCPNSVVYCCVWLHHNTIHTSGSGKASGYGYHKPSAAMQAAFGNAGIKLSEHIDGRGDSAMRDAMQAVGEFLSDSRYMVHNSHG